MNCICVVKILTRIGQGDLDHNTQGTNRYNAPCLHFEWRGKWSKTLLQNRPLFLAICPGSLWARDNRWLLSRVQRLAGLAGGDRGLLSRLEAPTGTKGPPFVPVGVSNRDKRPWPPYPLPSPPTRAIQLTCFLLFLARERGVLAHFFTTFVKIFDSPSIHRR